MAFLKIMSGEKTGTVVELGQDQTVIGRLTDNAVPLDDPAVSSRHCSILREGQKFTLRDLNSTNGTRLNEMKIRECRLKPKDIIIVGAVEIMFDGDDVEVDPVLPVPTTVRPLPTVKPGETIHSAPIGRASPFGTRRDYKWLWVSMIVVVGVLALVAFVWFLYRLLSVR